jgi:hypothetical protein
VSRVREKMKGFIIQQVVWFNSESIRYSLYNMHTLTRKLEIFEEKWGEKK